MKDQCDGAVDVDPLTEDELGPLPRSQWGTDLITEHRRMKDIGERAGPLHVETVAVVQVKFGRGGGIVGSTYRNVTQWWLDGKLIGEDDPCGSGG